MTQSLANMTRFQAEQIINEQRFIDAVLAYRRDPFVDKLTFRRAEMWIQASYLIASNL